MQRQGLRVRGAVSSAPCKVCNDASPLYGVTDFNKNCEEAHGTFLPLKGVPIYYHRCNTCGLIFTPAFDDWCHAEYIEHIYNDDYVQVDPEYIDVRAVNNAAMVMNFIKRGHALKCVDYGGGNGRLARALTECGVDATSWDPMVSDTVIPPPESFDFVSAFEVLEHTPDPVDSVREALGLLNHQGVLFFSTLTIDHLAPRAMDHWYIAPRNGHITLYTKRALTTLFGQFDYHVHHFSSGVHMALREAPAWLA